MGLSSCSSISHCLDKLSDLSAACKDLPHLLCLSCTSIQEDLLPQQQPESREQESDQQKKCRDHRALCDFLQRHENRVCRRGNPVLCKNVGTCANVAPSSPHQHRAQLWEHPFCTLCGQEAIKGLSAKKRGHCAEVSERSHFTWTAQPPSGSYLKPAVMQEASISATKINTRSHTVYLKQLFCNSCSSLSFQHLLKEVMQAGRNRNSCGCAMFANATCGKQHKTSNCREMRQA